MSVLEELRRNVDDGETFTRITSVNLYRSPHRELPELSLAPSEVRESGVGYEYKCTTGLDVNPEEYSLILPSNVMSLGVHTRGEVGKEAIVFYYQRHNYRDGKSRLEGTQSSP